MHAAMHGAGAGLGAQVLSSTPPELGERLPLVLKGKAVVVNRKDAADNLPFGRGKRAQVKEPLSVVFAPDTHASQKVSPSGAILIERLLGGLQGLSRCVQTGWTVSEQSCV